MAGNPNSQMAWYKEAWNKLTPEQQAQVPLDMFIQMARESSSSASGPGSNDSGMYHFESSPMEFSPGFGPEPGDKAQRIQGFFGRTPGPENPLTNVFGEKIRMRRETSPYMMNENPINPEMWDELPDPGDPRIFRGYRDDTAARASLGNAWSNDRKEDLMRMQLKNKLRKENMGQYISFVQSDTLEDMIDAMMKQIAGGK